MLIVIGACNPIVCLLTVVSPSVADAESHVTVVSTHFVQKTVRFGGVSRVPTVWSHAI